MSMMMSEQCNLLRTLYQKKYYQESIIRQTSKQSQQLKSRLKQYRQRRHQDNNSECTKDKEQSSPQLLRGHNKIYDFQYCNRPIQQARPVSYREFALKRERKKANSANCNREPVKTKQENWVEDLKNSILHSRESHYINLLNQRKSRHKLQKTLDSQHLPSQKYHQNSNATPNSSSPNISPSHYRTHQSFSRNTISQVRKRTTLTVLRNRATNKNKTHEIKRDDNDVLPWNVEVEEFL